MVYQSKRTLRQELSRVKEELVHAEKYKEYNSNLQKKAEDLETVLDLVIDLFDLRDSYPDVTTTGVTKDRIYLGYFNGANQYKTVKRPWSHTVQGLYKFIEDVKAARGAVMAKDALKRLGLKKS